MTLAAFLGQSACFQGDSMGGKGCELKVLGVKRVTGVVGRIYNDILAVEEAVKTRGLGP
jgi:hypothetical protein